MTCSARYTLNGFVRSVGVANEDLEALIDHRVDAGFSPPQQARIIWLEPAMKTVDVVMSE